MTATVSPIRTRYFCTRCGGQVEPKPAKPSIDPRYAIASCGDCGRMVADQLVPMEVFVITDEAEATRLVAKHRAKRAAELHRGHLAEGKAVKTCEACKAELAELKA